jgi:hypothetical protein
LALHHFDSARRQTDKVDRDEESQERSEEEEEEEEEGSRSN